MDFQSSYTGRKIRNADNEGEIIEQEVVIETPDINADAREELVQSINELLYGDSSDESLIRVYGKNAVNIVEEVIEELKPRLEEQNVMVLPMTYCRAHFESRLIAAIYSYLGRQISLVDEIKLGCVNVNEFCKYCREKKRYIIWPVEVVDKEAINWYNLRLWRFAGEPFFKIVMCLPNGEIGDDVYGEGKSAYYYDFVRTKAIQVN